MASPLDTRLDTLNRDHADLLQILQSAKVALLKGESLQDAASAVMEARTLFRLHSDKEEVLMRLAEFPEADGANADHLRLDELFGTVMQAAAERNRADLATRLHGLMVELVRHIRDFDRKYAEYISCRIDVPHLDPHLLRGGD
jgi:hemerythrin